jgi:hypothetical protein
LTPASAVRIQPFGFNNPQGKSGIGKPKSSPIHYIHKPEYD